MKKEEAQKIPEFVPGVPLDNLEAAAPEQLQAEPELLTEYMLRDLAAARQAADMLMINDISFYLAINPAVDKPYHILVPADLLTINPGVYNRLMGLVKRE